MLYIIGHGNLRDGLKAARISIASGSPWLSLVKVKGLMRRETSSPLLNIYHMTLMQGRGEPYFDSSRNRSIVPIASSYRSIVLTASSGQSRMMFPSADPHHRLFKKNRKKSVKKCQVFVIRYVLLSVKLFNSIGGRDYELRGI